MQRATTHVHNHDGHGNKGYYDGRPATVWRCRTNTNCTYILVQYDGQKQRVNGDWKHFSRRPPRRR